MREGHRPTHTCGPRWFGKSGTRWRSRMQALGSGCPMLERPPAAAVSASERREETRKAGETPSPGRVVIGQPAKETFNFKYFQQHFIRAQRINSGLASPPSPALCTQSRAGLGKVQEMGRDQPSHGTAHGPPRFASFCSSFPTCKAGRRFPQLLQAGQQPTSICKALPAP